MDVVSTVAGMLDVVSVPQLPQCSYAVFLLFFEKMCAFRTAAADHTPTPTYHKLVNAEAAVASYPTADTAATATPAVTDIALTGSLAVAQPASSLNWLFVVAAWLNDMSG